VEYNYDYLAGENARRVAKLIKECKRPIALKFTKQCCVCRAIPTSYWLSSGYESSWLSSEYEKYNFIKWREFCYKCGDYLFELSFSSFE